MVSSFSVIAFLFWSVLSVLEDETREAIEEEMAEMAAVHSKSGLNELINEVIERSHPIGSTHKYYFLDARRGAPPVGNLAAVKGFSVAGDAEWRETVVSWPPDVKSHGSLELRIAIRKFAGGYVLAIGRDISDIERIRAAFANYSILAGMIALSFGVLGGFLLSQRILQRIASINRTAAAIYEGDLRRRIPLQGTRDEFDQLAENLNNMIACIHRLVETTRGVTDNVAHDLRSPLNRLRNKIEVTLLRDKSETEYKQVLESAIGDVEEILTTFNAVLRIAQIESRSSKEGLEVVDLASVTLDVVELYMPAAEEGGVSIMVEAAPGSLIKGDPQLLYQAVANLLDNSIKYAGPNCHISVKVSGVQSAIVLEVSDNGPGIPEEHRDAVLRRFVRLDPPRSTVGTGLGLSLVAAIARHHGVAIRLEDNGPGLRVTLAFQRAK